MAKNKLNRAQVQQALINAKVTVGLLENSTNPQSQEICLKAMGRVEAFEVVLFAMDGELCFINIYSDKDKYNQPVS